jgi:hypothetical protein
MKQISNKVDKRFYIIIVNILTPHHFLYLDIWIEKLRSIHIRGKYLDAPIRSAFRRFNSNEGADINTLMYLIETKGLKINCLDQDENTPSHLLVNLVHPKLPNI